MKSLSIALGAIGIFAALAAAGCAGGSSSQGGAVPSAQPESPLKRNGDGTTDWKGLAAASGESPRQIVSQIAESLPGTPENDLSPARLSQEIDSQVSIRCDASVCKISIKE